MLAALAGGAVGALILLAGYFVGVALVGAGVGALLVNVAWKPFGGEPHWAVLLVAAAVGAIAAMSFQRYVIIVATAFGGAWTMLVGAAALMLGKGARAASSVNDVWVVYPNSAGPPGVWVYVAWVAVALVGLYVQLHTSGKAARAREEEGIDRVRALLPHVQLEPREGERAGRVVDDVDLARVEARLERARRHDHLEAHRLPVGRRSSPAP